MEYITLVTPTQKYRIGDTNEVSVILFASCFLSSVVSKNLP